MQTKAQRIFLKVNRGFAFLLKWNQTSHQQEQGFYILAPKGSWTAFRVVKTRHAEEAVRLVSSNALSTDKYLQYGIMHKHGPVFLCVFC